MDCQNCSSAFENPPEHREFLRSIGIETEPTECPTCRHQRRMAFRNERTLYRGECGLCKKKIVTIYDKSFQAPVYCSDCYWGTGWDALSYGREFDFNTPFFDQLKDLIDVIPRLCLNNVKSDNSDYCNQCAGNKDCYLTFASDDSRDCHFDHWINRCEDCLNCSNLADCKLCYDCVDCENAYHCVFSQDVSNSSDCFFCFDMIGSTSCFMSSSQRNKEYIFRNEKLSKEDYENKMKEIHFGNHAVYEELKKEFLQMRSEAPHKYVHILNSEECTGDYISSSKGCLDCFDAFECEDCRYCYNMVHKHFNCRDVSHVTELRNSYQCMSCIGEEICFSMHSWYSSDVWYSDVVNTSQHIFGCVGIQHKEYCILNKQYTKEEFDNMREKIIEHMKKTGEWGQYFPKNLSAFSYNETVGNDYLPLSKHDAIAQGFGWKDDIDEPPNATKVIPAERLPETITDTPDEILQWALQSQETGRTYKITKQELAFLREHKLPIPRLHPDERYRARMKLRNPRVLYDRECTKCQKDVRTTYSPERIERILCEECYRGEVY